MEKQSYKILGIDPGTLVTGYACIEASGSKIQLVDLGVIRPPQKERLSLRYFAIYQSIENLLTRFQPTHIALETPFVDKNAQSALKLGGAMAAVLLAGASHSIETFGYAPREVKKGVLGRGAGTKEEILHHLTLLLRLQHNSIPFLDATDALAIAVHHLQETKKIGSGNLNKNRV